MTVFVHLGGLQLAESVERGQIRMAHGHENTSKKEWGMADENARFWQKGVLANGPWPHLGGP